MLSRLIFLPVAGLSLLLLSSQAQATPVSSPDIGACGTSVDQAGPGEPAFVLPDYWHGPTPCFKDMRNLWHRSGPMTPVAIGGGIAISALVRDQVLFQMRQPNVLFVTKDGNRPLHFDEAFNSDLSERQPLDRVVMGNNQGQPYNGMGQAEMGYLLYSIASVAQTGGYPDADRDENFYRQLARLSYRTVLLDIDKGGLASWHNCERDPSQRCVWFHSVTRRDAPPQHAATLNQMLHVVRDMGLADAVIAKEGWNEPFNLATSAEAGINQLVLAAGHSKAGSPPNLADFAPEPGPRQNWAFYGFDPSRPAGDNPGYYLTDDGKNCGYHFHVLDLISQISAWAKAKGANAEALHDLESDDGKVRTPFLQAIALATSGNAPKGSCGAVGSSEE